MKQTNNRRNFLKLAFAGLALAPLARVADVIAAGMPKTKKIADKMIDAKTTKRLKYVDEASKAKKLKASGDKGYKKFKDGSNCGNCKFYKKSKEEGWGKCSMAGNKYVASEGWCKSYRMDKKKMK
jgi:hypothetical protein